MSDYIDIKSNMCSFASVMCPFFTYGFCANNDDCERKWEKGETHPVHDVLLMQQKYMGTILERQELILKKLNQIMK